MFCEVLVIPLIFIAVAILFLVETRDARRFTYRGKRIRK